MKLIDLVIKLLNFKNQENTDLTKVDWHIFELKKIRTEFGTNL